MIPFAITPLSRRSLLKLGILSAISSMLGIQSQALAQSAAATQAISDRPIKILVAAPAGGTADIIARLIGNAMSNHLVQAVVVDNKPGAGGAIAMDALLTAPKDGHTYLLSVNALVTELPYSIKPKYDPFNLNAAVEHQKERVFGGTVQGAATRNS